MDQLRPDDLMSLERYDEARDAFREKVLAHKKDRVLELGKDIVLFFEDRTTILYQVQEMLRVERIFGKTGIQEELDAYNPLIPDGSIWKATMMIQIPDESQRRIVLRQLVGVENCCWAKVEHCEQVYAVADEDINRTTDDKTSSVHFLRFELPAMFCDQVNRGSPISMGVDHAVYRSCIDPVHLPLAHMLRDDLD